MGLDRDIITLLEAVANEEAAVLEETRQRDPEEVLRKEFEERALLVEDKLVEDPANDKVEDESKDEDEEDSKGSLITRTTTAATSKGTTARSVLNKEEVSVLVLSDTDPITLRTSFVRVTDDSNSGLTGLTTSVGITTSVSNRKSGTSRKSLVVRLGI